MSRTSTLFQKGHISKRTHFKRGTFQKELIPKTCNLQRFIGLFVQWLCSEYKSKHARFFLVKHSRLAAATAGARWRERFGRTRHRQVRSSPSLHQSMTAHPSVSNCCRFVPVTTKALGLTLYLDPFKVRFSIFKLSIQK